jgi:branched-chain amino acid transport system substrate-binding protein
MTKLMRICLVVASAALALGVAACGSSSSSTDTTASSTTSGSSSSGGSANAGKPFVIGRVLARTGFMSAYDVPPAQAEDLYVNQMNAKGGINGRPIKFVDVDTKTDASLVATSAIQVLDKKPDVLLVSCDFDWGAPAALEAQKRNVVAISECAGSAKFGPVGIGPLAFTMGETAGGHAATWAEWAYQKKGWKNAYVLVDPSLAFEKEAAAGFQDRFKQLGGTIVGADQFQQKDTSIATQISRIKSLSTKPDFIVINSYPPGLQSAVKQIRAAGIDTPIVGDVSWDGEFWKKGLPKASNIYFNAYGSIYGDDPNPEVNKFFADFKKETGQAPPSSFVMTGYAIMQAIDAAVKKAGGSTDGAKLAGALETFKDQPLILGPTTFTKDQHADLHRELSIMQVQDGKTSFVTRWRPKVIPNTTGA